MDRVQHGGSSLYDGDVAGYNVMDMKEVKGWGLGEKVPPTGP